jgi:hypothetical protein
MVAPMGGVGDSGYNILSCSSCAPVVPTQQKYQKAANPNVTKSLRRSGRNCAMTLWNGFATLERQ